MHAAASWQSVQPNMDTDPGSDNRQNNSISPSPPKKCEIGEIQG